MLGAAVTCEREGGGQGTEAGRELGRKGTRAGLVFGALPGLGGSDVVPGAGGRGPGRGRPGGPTAPRVGGGRGAHVLPVLRFQEESRGEQHRLGQQDGLLGAVGAEPQPPPGGGAPASAGLAGGLSAQGERPARAGHGAAGPAAAFWSREDVKENEGFAEYLSALKSRGELQRESDFMASVDSSWISWGVGVFLLKPLKWTLSNMLGDNKVPAEEVLVAVELLKEKAEEVYRLYQNSPLSSHPVVALSELSTLCANSCPDERTFYLVLLQLQKEKRVTVLEQNGEKIVKFARGPHAKVSPVNDVDVGVYQLMQSEQLLSRKVESLSQEAERCKEEARRACRAGKKQLALRSLKAKQRTEKRIEALHAKLDTVQGILDRIYASQTDQMVFNAYQAGVGALKLSMKDVTVEKAESLVDQIQELCDTQDEVSQTLAGGVTNGLDFDSEELEKELDILLQDTTKEPLDLPDNRRSRHFTNSVPNPRISDAELEAELEKLSLSEGGLVPSSKSPKRQLEPTLKPL
ncbi:charged multivesicular body protein 7 isoform X1 [Papio anubis]|uniref:charged multivesicular body protein 7 isoform X1 n=1 Tax=Papio anubis TaxID=9555 RepID=UPI0012AD6178|nr:charged multivesicular body protein 7 isoform X1 [Papio anubis]XP_021797830.2 charged multivesicular body protein 7 isoform X1 [Papio anubis]